MNDILNKIGTIHRHEAVSSALKVGVRDNSNNPIITVVMPVFKRPEMLRNALESIVNQHVDFSLEILVVDNNEETKSPNEQIVRSFKNPNILYYHNEKNLGMYGNINRGIFLAKGKFITFCHDDDTFCENTLNILYQFSKTTNSCILGEHNKIDENSNIISKPNYPNRLLYYLKKKPMYRLSMLDTLIRVPGLGGGGCLFERDKLVEIGGFDEDSYPGSDYELIIRYINKYGAIQLTDPTYNYRIADNVSFNVSKVFADCNRDYQKCMKNAIPLPGFLVDWIISMQYEWTSVEMQLVWNKDNSIKHRFLNYAVIKLLNIMVKLKAYKLF